MLSYDFNGKAAFVTGGGSGMGRAVSLRFAVAGAKVVVFDIVAKHGRETVEMIRGEGGDAMFVGGDISIATDVESGVAEALRAYGKIDAACNTAAIDIETASLAECEDDDFDKVIAVNLRGTYLCMKHQVRQMLKQGTGGTIVNFSSVAAYRSKGLQLNAYVAAKSGVLALSRIAAMKYASEGIRINTIVPGAIDTPMLRTTLASRGLPLEDLEASYGLMGRVGRPEEIAEAVLWLSSENSSFTVGANIPVDGGSLIG